MIVVLARFSIRPAHVASWRALIAAHAERCVRLEPGCLQFEASFDPADETKWLLYEVYVDRDALVAHRRLPHFAQFFEPAQAYVETRDVKEYAWSAGARKATPLPAPTTLPEQ